MNIRNLRLALVLTLGTAPLAAIADTLRIEPTASAVEWNIYHGGQKVLVYSFDPAKNKPYIKGLNTLGGYGVLRDSPADHLHHHGLMYGIKVNGLNFWEEAPGAGVEKAVDSPIPETGTTAAGLPQVTIRQTLHWLAPEDAFRPNSPDLALLIERRSLVLTVNPSRREVALEWKSQFRVGGKTNKVVLTGANYHGLGMRFLEELDPVAVHFSSDGKPDLAGGKTDTSTHAWMAVHFDLPGKRSTIALFGAANNARGLARYFSMKVPFAYLSATQALDKEPLVYERGEQFELKYLVVVYPELISAETLTKRSLEWSASSP